MYGSLLQLRDYTVYNAWWDRLMIYPEALGTFGKHYLALSSKEQEDYFPSFIPDVRYGIGEESLGLVEYNRERKNYDSTSPTNSSTIRRWSLGTCTASISTWPRPRSAS